MSFGHEPLYSGAEGRSESREEFLFQEERKFKKSSFFLSKETGAGVDQATGQLTVFKEQKFRHSFWPLALMSSRHSSRRVPFFWNFLFRTQKTSKNHSRSIFLRQKGGRSVKEEDGVVAIFVNCDYRALSPLEELFFIICLLWHYMYGANSNLP